MRSKFPAALVAVLLAGVVGCDSGGKGDNTADTSAGDTDNSIAPVDPSTVYPLTGLPITDQAAASRPAMVVKIDNDSNARPQAGLNAADVVFEEIIEFQTRFAAVFHSQGSDPVGPIRSARGQDIDLVAPLNRPLFVFSGANPGITAAIEASDLVALSALDNSVYTNGGFFRDEGREAPHNEYAATSQLWALAPADAGPPLPLFHYRAPGEAPIGDPSLGVDLNLEGLPVSWQYDAATDSYLRFSDGVPHIDAATGQITTENVVVMVVDYLPSDVDYRSADAVTVGFGEAWVFTAGKWVRGAWTRASGLSPIEFFSPSGHISLTPGRTWVELAKSGTFSALP